MYNSDIVLIKEKTFGAGMGRTSRKRSSNEGARLETATSISRAPAGSLGVY